MYSNSNPQIPLEVQVQALADFAYWASIQWVAESNIPNVRYKIMKCYQPSSGLRGVLKMTKSPNERIQSMIKEQEFLDKLKHPNIVPLIAHGVFCGRPYVLTQLCERGSTVDFINNIPLGVDRAEAVRSFFQQLIRGLSYMHENRVTHGDIKPANLLVERDGNLQICDFEFARYNPQAGKIVCQSAYGTLPYMPPEIYNKQDYCPFAADIWMAGTSVLQLLTSYKWSKPSVDNKKFRDFFSWKETKLPKIINIKEEQEEVLTGMIDVAPEKRMFLEEIKSTRWYRTE